jgi:hypothetical protein
MSFHTPKTLISLMSGSRRTGATTKEPRLSREATCGGRKGACLRAKGENVLVLERFRALSWVLVSQWGESGHSPERPR